jgi:hypothetical protein
VRFWTIEKSRNNFDLGSKMTVSITNIYWSSDESNIIKYAEGEFDVSDYGTISGELSYSGLKPGAYEIVFKQGDKEISKQIFTVVSYAKPAYKISVVSDKSSIFAGDVVTFKIKAEFFDGTPLSNTKLSYSSYGSGVNISGATIILDKAGEAQLPIQTKYSSTVSTFWYLTLNIRSALEESGDISADSYVYVFGPHIKDNC